MIRRRQMLRCTMKARAFMRSSGLWGWLRATAVSFRWRRLFLADYAAFDLHGGAITA